MYSINRRPFFGRWRVLRFFFYFFLLSLPSFQLPALTSGFFYGEKCPFFVAFSGCFASSAECATFPRGLVALFVFPSNAPPPPPFRTFRSLHRPARVVARRDSLKLARMKILSFDVTFEHQRLAREKINLFRSRMCYRNPYFY